MENDAYNLIVLKTISYRLYLNQAQTSHLFHFLRTGRKFYNYSLEQRILYYQETGESLSKFSQCADLTILRSVSLVFADVPVLIERDALDRLDKAFANFFRRVKEGTEKPGFPRFKSANRWNSFTIPISGSGAHIIQGQRIRIAGVEGTIRYRGGRSVQGEIKVQRIVHRAGKWFCQLVVDSLTEAPPLQPIQSVIGIDVGLNSFATTDSGEKIENPRFYRKLERELKRASRNVSRKVKGSRNRRWAVRRLQAVHETIRNARLNFTHHLSKRIVAENQLIAVEKLNIKGMAQGRLAKSIMDAAWGQFLFQLEYKAENAGVLFCAVNPAGTSQECNQCGQKALKDLSVRIHKCLCGLVLDRDWNAAKNILARAIRSAPAAGRADSKACGEATEPR